MSSTLITNIKQLVSIRPEDHLLRGKELCILPCIENAYLLIEDEVIAEFGEMSKLSPDRYQGQSAIGNVIDASGHFILPAWCDSHTHLVFAASREDEFVSRTKGMSYAEIAQKGGGI